VGEDVIREAGRVLYGEEYALPPIPEQIQRISIHDDGKYYIKMDPRPDAIILPSFTSALQAISIARLNGISVPHDIAIVSFDEDPECRYAIPSITAIEKPAKEIGEEIARTAIRICTGDIQGKESVRVFSSNLIIRGSSFSR
jgi:LacI family transcriptional regulator